MQAVKRCGQCNAQNDSGQIYCAKCGKFLSARAAGIPKSITVWDMEVMNQKKDKPVAQKAKDFEPVQKYLVICPQCNNTSAAVNGMLPLACDKCGYFFQAGIDNVVPKVPQNRQRPDAEEKDRQPDVQTVSDDYSTPAVLSGRRNPLASAKKDTSSMRFIVISQKEAVPEEADEKGGIIGNNGTILKWIKTSQQMSFRHAPTGWYVQILAGQPLYNGVPVNAGRQMRLYDGDILTIEKEQIRVEIV